MWFGLKANKPFVQPTCRELTEQDARNARKFSDDGPHQRPQPRLSDRKYQPWPWELPGARFWPWLTIERHIGEELRLRHDRKMPHRHPLWPEDDLIRSRPTVFAIESPYYPACIVPIQETCVAERPMVCPTRRRKPYINYVNWQWLPHSLSSI